MGFVLVFISRAARCSARTRHCWRHIKVQCNPLCIVVYSITCACTVLSWNSRTFPNKNILISQFDYEFACSNDLLAADSLPLIIWRTKPAASACLSLPLGNQHFVQCTERTRTSIVLPHLFMRREPAVHADALPRADRADVPRARSGRAGRAVARAGLLWPPPPLRQVKTDHCQRWKGTVFSCVRV